MKRPSCISLFFPFLFLCQSLYATYSSYGLGEPRSDSGYEGLKIYIRTYGQNFNENEAAPSRLKVLCDWGVHKTGNLNTDGVPEWVQLSNYSMGFHTIRFEYGNPEGVKTTSKGKKIKLVLLDKQGNPVYGEPTYFQITGYDGAQYRVHAKNGPGHHIGHPVFAITPEGKKHEFEQSGFDIVLDENKDILQVRDTEKTLLISYPSEKKRRIDIYHTYQIEPEKINGRYILKEGNTPYQTIFLYHLESDDKRIMKYEFYVEGELEEETTWIRRDEEEYFSFEVKKPGQEIPEIYDVYSNDPQGGRIKTNHIYRNEGNYQFNAEKFYDYVDKTWRSTYRRKVSRGQETIHRYKYLEDLSSGKLIQYTTLHQPAEGAWFRKTYDNEGRITMEWTPSEIETVVSSDIEDPALRLLMTLLGVPVKTEKEIRYDPEKAPEDLELAKTQGKVVYYEYTPLFNDDTLTPEDHRPRMVRTWEDGTFISREWFAYGIRPDGVSYEFYEWSEHEDTLFGDETHRRRNREFHPKDHPIAANKQMSIAHEDGTLEMFYYDKGHFYPDRKFFEVDGTGEDLRIVSTRGTLKEGAWTAGSTSKTLIHDPEETVVYQEKRELLEDGRWQSL